MRLKNLVLVQEVYEFSLTLNDYQGLSTIRYNADAGEYSLLKRAISTMSQVREFQKVLG